MPPLHYASIFVAVDITHCTSCKRAPIIIRATSVGDNTNHIQYVGDDEKYR